jgi:endonuclease YncB( thermonuclease family)
VLGASLFGLLIPGDLFGSSPHDRARTMTASDVRVLDGDTLRLGDQVLRLAGLAVPDRGRASCLDATGQRTDCAAAAAEALAQLVQGRPVECRVQGHDRLGRALGTCRAGGMELNGSLIAAGWALADATSPALLPLEAVARKSGRGLWAKGATPPESWRERF